MAGAVRRSPAAPSLGVRSTLHPGSLHRHQTPLASPHPPLPVAAAAAPAAPSWADPPGAGKGQTGGAGASGTFLSCGADSSRPSGCTFVSLLSSIPCGRSHCV